MTLDEVNLLTKIAALETENQRLASQLSAVELSLRELRERLEVTAVATGVGFWEWHIPARELVWDEQCTGFFGVSPSAPDFYDSFYRRVFSEDYQRIEREYRRMLETRQDSNMEIRVLRPDGQMRWIHIRGQGIFGENGCPQRFVGIAMDVTERHSLEQHVREDAARLQDNAARLQDNAARLQDNAARIEVQRRLIELREQERQQIARDLHDGPIQDLTADTFLLQEVMEGCPYPTEKKQLAQVVQSLQEQIQELRAFAVELRPPMLIQFGLEKAIQAHLETFRPKHPRVSVKFTFHRQGPLLPETTRLAFYRIYQEALNNVVKHSQASQVTIHFAATPTRATLSIRDNGVGFAPPADWLSLAREGHLGLVGIRERAEAMGGLLEIASEPGGGTTLTLQVELTPPVPLSPGV